MNNLAFSQNEVTDINKTLVELGQKTFSEILNKGIFPNSANIQKSIELQYKDSPYLSRIKKTILDWSDNFSIPYFYEYITNNVSELIIHSHELIEVIDKYGIHSKVKTDTDPIDYQLLLEKIVHEKQVDWNIKNPFVSYNIKNNSQNLRLTFIHTSISGTNSSKLFIRNMINHKWTYSDFNIEEKNTLFFKEAIESKKNIVIAGSTGSGKTTFLKMIAHEIPKEEHIISLEDTKEIGAIYDNWTNLISTKTQSLTDYCSYILRMSPDRIVLGEMRSKEIVPFLLNINTGHNGMLSTIHANSAQNAIERMAFLFSIYAKEQRIDHQLVLKMICSNIDYVVFIEQKKIKEIINVISYDNGHLFHEKLS